LRQAADPDPERAVPPGFDVVPGWVAAQGLKAVISLENHDVFLSEPRVGLVGRSVLRLSPGSARLAGSAAGGASFC
jgi:hypothetical protein